MRWKSVGFLRKRHLSKTQKVCIEPFQGENSALGIKTKQLLFLKFINQDNLEHSLTAICIISIGEVIRKY